MYVDLKLTFSDGLRLMPVQQKLTYRDSMSLMVVQLKPLAQELHDLGCLFIYVDLKCD